MKPRSIILVLVVFLFIGIFIIFSPIGRCEIKDGNTIYVGGTSFGNYSSIQEGINASSSGDTIIVYNGTYMENLVLSKSITLTGMNGYGTIIDGGGSSDVVVVSADNVFISNFTVQNSGSSDAGINILSNNCIISENNIVNNGWCGIKTGDTCKNYTVTKNIIRNNGYGIFFKETTFNINFNKNAISKTLGMGSIDADINDFLDNSFSNNNDLKEEFLKTPSFKLLFLFVSLTIFIFGSFIKRMIR